MNINIPSYPCDKEIFPAIDSYPEAQAWRESTTFFNDFKIAEMFGLASVKDTFYRAFKSWQNSAKYMCELTVVTNQLCWLAHHHKKYELSKFYSDCYYKCRDYIFQADDEGNNAGPFSDEERKIIAQVLD